MFNPDRTMHLWSDDSPMYFGGQVLLGRESTTATVYFDRPVTNVAITSGPDDSVFVDSIVGITDDGIRIPIGYTATDGGLVHAPLFFDGFRYGCPQYLVAERNLQPPPVTGMVGL